MEDEEFFVVIKYYFLREKYAEADVIKEKLDKHFGKSAPSLQTIENCIDKCEEAMREKAIKEIHDIVLDDQRVKENEIDKILDQRYQNYETFANARVSPKDVLNENLKIEKTFHQMGATIALN